MFWNSQWNDQLSSDLVLLTMQANYNGCHYYVTTHHRSNDLYPEKWWNAYNLYTDSLSFWLIYHRRLTDIPPTINGRRVSQVSATISTEISADSRSIRRPSLGRYLGWYIGRYVARHISADILTATRSICQQTYRLTLSRDVDRCIGRLSVDMSTEMLTDISVEGCTKYTWTGYLSSHIQCALVE